MVLENGGRWYSLIGMIWLYYDRYMSELYKTYIVHTCVCQKYLKEMSHCKDNLKEE